MQVMNYIFCLFFLCLLVGTLVCLPGVRLCTCVRVCVCVCVRVCACVVRVCVLRASVSSPGLVASGHFPQEFPSADHTQVHGGLLYLLRSEGKATTPLTPLHHTTNTVDFADLSRDCLDAPEANS